MSPSKRAGDTVEPEVGQQTDAPGCRREQRRAELERVQRVARHDGHDRHDDDDRCDRQPTGAPEAPLHNGLRHTAARAGTVSQRGASSSSITRRSATGAAPAAAAAAAAAAKAPDTSGAPPADLPAPVPVPDDEPTTPEDTAVVESPIVLPPARSRIEPSTRRPAEPEIAEPPLPVVTPAAPPAQRGSPAVTLPIEPIVPPEVPYVTTTMSSHQVAPVPRLVGRRPRVRKVTRVVRHVDPWSIFKVALVFNLVLYAILLTAGVLLWNVAYATGTVDNLERFFESFGWSEFEFDGGAIYHSAWIAGLFGVVGLTGAAVLAATLFNLITDLVGGIRMTVLEEEVVERTTSPMRRFVVRRPTAGGPDPGDELRPEGSTLPARQEPDDDPFR